MPPTDKPVSRREFARRAALGAASASLLPLHELVPGSAVAAPAQPPQVPGAEPKLSPQSQAEAESRYQTIVQQYPNRFSEAQKGDLRRLCVSAQPPLDHLRAYVISNGDLPALYLKPLVDRDKKPATKSPASSPGAKPSTSSPTAPKAPAAMKPPATGKP
jgi:hypothetical protein